MPTQRHTTPRPLPPDALAGLGSVAEVCDVLRGWGRPDLADRLAYFASDEDLDDGDVPLTLESALGFLAFFGAVDSEGKVSLTCSPEGWVSADWRFPDQRIMALWFIDIERVDYAARKSDGHFIDLDRNGSVANLGQVAEHLVDLREWFTWFKGNPAAMSSPLHST